MRNKRIHYELAFRKATDFKTAHYKVKKYEWGYAFYSSGKFYRVQSPADMHDEYHNLFKKGHPEDLDAQCFPDIFDLVGEEVEAYPRFYENLMNMLDEQGRKSFVEVLSIYNACPELSFFGLMENHQLLFGTAAKATVMTFDLDVCVSEYIEVLVEDGRYLNPFAEGGTFECVAIPGLDHIEDDVDDIFYVYSSETAQYDFENIKG
jgi:hypothetical protein